MLNPAAAPPAGRPASYGPFRRRSRMTKPPATLQIPGTLPATPRAGAAQSMPRRLPSAGLRLLVAAVLALLVAVVGAVDLARKVDSFKTIGFSAAPVGGAWRVLRVDSPGTGLRPGDGLLMVDAGAAGTAQELRQRLLANDQARLTVLRDAALVEVPYRRPQPQPDLHYLVLAGAGIIYLLIGLYALMNARRSPAGVFFLWATASAAVYLCTQVPGVPPDALAKLSYCVEEVGRLLLPPLTLHLFLLFPVPVLIEWISSIITMQPGDCIMTGTPAGCGTFRSPPVWLKPGDEVVLTEDTIGTLRNPVRCAS